MRRSQIIPDKNDYLVWRREYFEGGDYANYIPAAVTAIHTHTVTLGEVSHVRLYWKCEVLGPITASALCKICRDGVMKDETGARIQSSDTHDLVTTYNFWEDTSLAAGTYVYTFTAFPIWGANTIFFGYNSAAIDVCRA